MQQLFDYYFWIPQPSSVLSNYDLMFGYFFAGLLGLYLLILAGKVFVKHPVNKKLLTKIQNLAVTISVFGLIWFGFRYESAPIFARRYWAGLVLLVALIWLGFILKYIVFNFFSEKSEYQRQELKNKYLPKS